MKTLSIPAILIFVLSCSNALEKQPKIDARKAETEVYKKSFGAIIDSSNLEGAILLFDAQSGVYYSNNFDRCRSGQLPASTFKIPNSIIALETGVIENDSTLFEWDGEPRMFKHWEQDLAFRQAFHFSCVPCYREVARKIGVERMQEYLKKFNYGAMDVNSTTIDNFWLTGASRINQFQQIDFLKRFYQSELPITGRTETIMKKMIVMEENEHYKLSGKTGWSTDNGKDNGWFVGYIETKGKIYYFATNVTPKEGFDMELFSKARKEITYKALDEHFNLSTASK